MDHGMMETLRTICSMAKAGYLIRMAVSSLVIFKME